MNKNMHPIKPLFISWLFFISATIVAQNPARSGTDHAVFFYVTDFQPDWQALPETKTEMEAIAAKLKEDYGFTVDFVPNPTKADIRKKVLELNSRQYKEKDQLLLFFSMHGYYIHSADRGYLIPSDGKTPQEDTFGDTWVSYEDLGTWVSKNPCKHIMLSLDACFSGAFGIRQSATERSKSYPGDVKKDASQECREREQEALLADSYLYYSSGGLVRTPAQSKFAEAWLQALNEGWLKKVITVKELDYAFAGMKNPAPEGGIFSQNKNGGDFIFLHKTACAAAPPIDKAADKAAWNKAKTANTFDAFRQYVADFPNGEFRSLAESRIADLEKAQKEELAWADAKRLDTWEAYDGFLRDYPNSEYRELAEFNRSKLTPPKATTSSGSKVADLPNFVFVQGGPFSMGSKDGSNETPHDVTLSDFYLAVNELTFEEYDAYCTATGTTKPDDQGWGRGKRPVINVSWEDAAAYCNWRSGQDGLQIVYKIVIEEEAVDSKTDIRRYVTVVGTPYWSANGYRLPTEAEWEYAARSRGKDEKWAGTSSESSLSAYGNFCDKNCEYDWKTAGQSDGYGNTAPVGSFRSNALGLNDMSGNVWEWCNDWYDSSYYGSSPSRDPYGPDSGSSRVLRGGSWYDIPAYLRCAYRHNSSPDYRGLNYGFRLARAAR